jgi:hypothetical protein
MSERWKEVLVDVGKKALVATAVVVVEELIRRNVSTDSNVKTKQEPSTNTNTNANEPA